MNAFHALWSKLSVVNFTSQPIHHFCQSDDSDQSTTQAVRMKKQSSSKEASAAKKAKTEDQAPIAMPSSIVVTFSDNNGAKADGGTNIDLPIGTTSKQLELLINSLLGRGDSDPLPYACFVNGYEIENDLTETLNVLQRTPDKVDFETTIEIKFQPLSVYKVRPVSRCMETMPGHTDAVVHLSYSNDGKRLASGGGDMAVRFWNVTTNMPQHTCMGHQHHVICTGWTPNGTHFVSADRSGEIRVWNPANGTPHGQPLRGHKKWVTSLAFEPLHADPSCTRFASSSADTTIKVWNLTTGACLTTISGHLDSVECVKWGGTGLLYSCSRDRTIKVWAIDDTGRNMHKLVRTLAGHAHRINTLALNSDFICRTGAYQFGIPGEGTPQQIARKRYDELIGVDGEKLVSGSDDFTLFMWRPQVDKHPVVRMVGHQQLINHIAFSPDGRFVASGSFDKKVKLWCGKTGRFLATFLGHVGSVYQLSWSSDSTFIASASKDSTVKVWSIKDHKKAVNTCAGHEDEVYALDWSPAGTQLASGSKDRTIKIWHH